MRRLTALASSQRANVHGILGHARQQRRAIRQETKMNKLILVIELPEAPDNFEPLAMIDYLSSKVKKLQTEFKTTVNYEWHYLDRR